MFKPKYCTKHDGFTVASVSSCAVQKDYHCIDGIWFTMVQNLYWNAKNSRVTGACPWSCWAVYSMPQAPLPTQGKNILAEPFFDADALISVPAQCLLCDYNILSISLSWHCIDLKLVTFCANKQVLVNPVVKCIGQVNIAVAECMIYSEERLFCLSLKRISDLHPSRVPRIHLSGRRTGWHPRSSWQWMMASMMARWTYGLLELPALSLVSLSVTLFHVLACFSLLLKSIKWRVLYSHY